MLDDRSYMREPSYGQGLSASAKLMIALGGIFIVQAIDSAYFDGWTTKHLSLHPDQVVKGHIWQLFTFQLLHGGALHLLFNLLAVWMFGRSVESFHGSSRMLQMFLLCGLAGGLLQVLCSLIIPGWGGMLFDWGKRTPIPTMGASAGTMGFLAAYCLLEPGGNIIVYFVPVQARILLYIALGMSLFLSVVPMDPGTAHPAHLGGLLAGMAIVRYGYPDFSRLTRLFARSTPPKRLTAGRPASATKWSLEKIAPISSRGSSTTGQDFISKEVDPILDKISTHGFQSLTEEERKTLEAARNRMNRP